jgi:RNase P/RNase MRP subunit p30
MDGSILRKFVDLHLKPPADANVHRMMLELAIRLGFRGLGVVLEGKADESVEETASDPRLDIVSRVDLKPRNPRELTAALGRVRGRFEVVAVECQNKSVARQAAKDNRVDVLNFPVSVQARRRAGFDRQEASLAAGSNCTYEINVFDLLGKGPMVVSGLLSIVREEVYNAKRCAVPIVVSSGAGDPLHMRGPRGLAAILGLLNIGEEEGLDTVSTNPWRIIEANREKFGQGFVVPGVRVV